MNLVTPSFRLELVPAAGAGAGAAEAEAGWVGVRVRAGVCGFRADFEARTRLESLRGFERELAAMERAEPGTRRAGLSCDEPGVDVRLEAHESGTIEGHFALESRRRGEAWTTLSGTFELEPDALPALRASIRDLVSALEH